MSFIYLRLNNVPLGLPMWRNGRVHMPVQETQETWVRSLGLEDLLEEDTATHSNILARKIPWTGGRQSVGCKESNMTERLGTHACACVRVHTHTHTHTRFHCVTGPQPADPFLPATVSDAAVDAIRVCLFQLWGVLSCTQ